MGRNDQQEHRVVPSHPSGGAAPGQPWFVWEPGRRLPAPLDWAGGVSEVHLVEHPQAGLGARLLRLRSCATALEEAACPD